MSSIVILLLGWYYCVFAARRIGQDEVDKGDAAAGRGCSSSKRRHSIDM